MKWSVMFRDTFAGSMPLSDLQILLTLGVHMMCPLENSNIGWIFRDSKSFDDLDLVMVEMEGSIVYRKGLTKAGVVVGCFNLTSLLHPSFVL
jgi:hypothetical protein